MRVVFWGTGDLAKRELPRIKELSDDFEVVAFIDDDQSNAGDDYCSFLGGGIN